MKLNLKFYRKENEKNNTEIEDKILSFIKKYPDNYEKAFNEDSSWQTIYHLSDIRKNVIRWYPFKPNSTILEIGSGFGTITEELCKKCKNVTTIELSKKRAMAILERNKKNKNLEIIVGNFKDIVLKKKYDYILLNGVLEYAALYFDSDNPYSDFIDKLKENLCFDGKILIAIENRFGLKYWCGANEDHTNIQFDGLNNYPDFRGIRTFSKSELEALANKCKMYINFYYMFPDYKFPQVIYTDKSLKKGIYVDYLPYYSVKPNLLFNELKLFKDIYNNNVIPFFANSFFLEFSLIEEEIKVDFVKFNDYRKKSCNLYTLCMNNKFYKYFKFDAASEFFNNYLNCNKELCKIGYDAVIINHDSYGYYTDEVCNKSFLDLIKDEYLKIGEQALLKNLRKYDEYNRKRISFKKVNNKKDIFAKYNINISDEKRSKLHFVSKLYIDIIPLNMICSDDDYLIIDQEWFFINAPYEYLLYRAISNTLYNCVEKYDFDVLLKYLRKFKLDDFIQEFNDLEVAFQNSIKDDNYNAIKSFTLLGGDSRTISINDFNSLIDEKNNLMCINSNLENEKNNLIDINSNLENEKNNLIDINNSLESEKNILIAEKDNISLEKTNLLNEKESIILENELLKNSNIDLSEKLANTEKYLSDILNSNSWKMTGFLRKIKKIIKK